MLQHELADRRSKWNIVWCLPLFSGAGISPSLQGRGDKSQTLNNWHRANTHQLSLLCATTTMEAFWRLECEALQIVQLHVCGPSHFWFWAGTHITWTLKNRKCLQAACVSLSHTTDTDQTWWMMAFCCDPLSEQRASMGGSLTGWICYLKRHHAVFFILKW